MQLAGLSELWFAVINPIDQYRAQLLKEQFCSSKMPITTAAGDIH